MEINKKLERKLEDVGLDNLHSYSVLLMIQNSSLFEEQRLEEYIHDSDMGDYLIKAGVLSKVKGKWVITPPLLDSKDWATFKYKLFNEYNFTLKGHKDNEIGYFISNEKECINNFNLVMKKGYDIDQICKEAEKYYAEGSYLKSLDNWLLLMEVVSNSFMKKNNDYV